MLNRMALRLCAVQATIGRTLAEESIKDSEITPVALTVPNDKRPYVAVYTDDQGPNELTLTFEIGVTAAMTVANEDGKPELSPGIPATDAGVELLLDAIERQIHVALADPANAWGELLRLLFSRPWEIRSRRGANAVEGVRFAGRQVALTGKPLADPEYGRLLPEEGFWARFLAALDASEIPGLSTQADLIRSLLGVDATVVDWQRMQAAIVATRGQTEALGIAPRFGEEMADIETIEIEGGG